MLSLSKRVDYALIALAYLAERPGRVAPARQIAAAHDLPPALLMKILKVLHQQGILQSLRGTKGGYQLAIDPATYSLYDLIALLEGPVRTIECTDHPAHEAGESGAAAEECDCRALHTCPVQRPLKALHERLVRFLREVRLADIILPGSRVDVPLEMVGVAIGENPIES